MSRHDGHRAVMAVRSQPATQGRRTLRHIHPAPYVRTCDACASTMRDAGEMHAAPGAAQREAQQDHEKAHARKAEVNNMIWTIFAVIGIIVVIGWIIGRL